MIALRFFERLGRVLMMDFGFGSFFEKFEGRFGRTATTILLMLIGVSVASVCVNLTVVHVVAPVIAFIQALWSEDPAMKATVGDTISTALSLFFFMFLCLNFWDVIKGRRVRKRIDAIKVEYDEFLRHANEFWIDSSRYVETLDTLANDLETARNAKQRREVIADLRGQIFARRQEYGDKVKVLNANIREMRS